MGGSISKQQKQQIASYRTRFIFGEPGLNLMKEEDVSDNEKICRELTLNFKLNQKLLIEEILNKIETNPDDVIDNNGVLLCSSQGIDDIFRRHIEKSPIYIQQQTNNQPQAYNAPQQNANQPQAYNAPQQTNNQLQAYNAPQQNYQQNYKQPEQKSNRRGGHSSRKKKSVKLYY